MTESSTSMSDEVVRSTGWCMPSEPLVALFTMSNQPPPDCEKHTWRRIYRVVCECSACTFHLRPSHLECSVCYEEWSPYSSARQGWQEVWDCLQDT